MRCIMPFRPIEEVKAGNTKLLGQLNEHGFGLEMGKLHDRIKRQIAKYDVGRALDTNRDLARKEEIWGIEGGKALGDEELDRLVNNTLVALCDADAMLRNVEGRKAISVIVMGSSGSGKTTFTRAVSEALEKGNLADMAEDDPQKKRVFQTLQAMHEVSAKVFKGGLFPLNKETFSQLEALGYDPEKHADTFWKIRPASAAAKEVAQAVFEERKQVLGHRYDNYEESLMDTVPGKACDDMMARLDGLKKSGQQLVIIYIVPENGVEGAVANDKARGEGPEKRTVGEEAVRKQYEGAMANVGDLMKMADMFVTLTLPVNKVLRDPKAADSPEHRAALLTGCEVTGVHAAAVRTDRDAANRGGIPGRPS